jgi:crossover junction endodeoxyribonuclease RusA
MVCVDLQWPPSVNHYWFANGNRRFIAKRGKDFRADVVRRCFAVKPQEGRLAVFITAYPPDHRRRDVDNICKALLDALQHAGVYEDDAQIDALVVTRGDVVPGGKVNVLVCQHRTASQRLAAAMEEERKAA